MDTKKLRQKILDLAIRGKLVPQDPSDEPASVLLERIRAEKERLIKEGKIKRSKKTASDDEIEAPFEIPESWEWIRFGEYLDVRDGTHDTPKYVEKGYPFVTSKNLSHGRIDFTNVNYISESDHLLFSKRSFVEDGDILFAMIGSIGNPVLVKKDR
jgi:type I restriction enzyme S subunit